jgi:formate-dependent phosphoribosylglycinamide formyltransferase (GAR transformylase)
MRILLIAATTGYQTRVFAGAAGRLGFELTLATDRCHVLDDPWGDQAIPLRFEDPKVAAESISGEFGGVVAVGDRPAYIASLVAERLGLRFSPPDAVAACRDKFLARERFRQAGLLTPSFRRAGFDANVAAEAAAAIYPCVLKPVGLSASRGVIRANNPNEFLAAFERIRALVESPELRRLDETRAAVVESFIPGREFALEGLLTGGKLRTLAIFDKPDPLEGPFFEETIYTTPSREPENVQFAIQETTKSAVQALGLTDGPVHAEMRVNDRGVWMLEIAARPIGGLCARSLRFEHDASLEELILRHAAGEDTSGIHWMPGASGVMMIPIPYAGVYGGARSVDRARATPYIEDIVITAKQGQELQPLPEGASYLGFIFARADTPADVERALREAHSALEFEISTALPVVR